MVTCICINKYKPLSIPECSGAFFVRLYENDAAGLTHSKEFSCKMTENMQADAPPALCGIALFCPLFQLGLQIFVPLTLFCL